MASLRDIRKRIRSVGSTEKITKAMKMVSAARLRRAQESVEQSRPYSEKIDELLRSLAGSVPEGIHPLLDERTVKKRILIVLTSDRGLCGAFNANLLRQAEQIVREDTTAELLLIGRKAISYFERRDYPIYKKLPEYWHGFEFKTSADLAAELSKAYTEKKIDRVDILYNEFISVMTQRPKTKTVLPFAAPKPEFEASDKTNEKPEKKADRDYDYEPGREEIVMALVPRAVDMSFYVVSLNSLAGEYGARMTAMDSASRNAREMIDDLTLHANRVRQATITTELMEIIGGAEALNG